MSDTLATRNNNRPVGRDILMAMGLRTAGKLTDAVLNAGIQAATNAINGNGPQPMQQSGRHATKPLKRKAAEPRRGGIPLAFGSSSASIATRPLTLRGNLDLGPVVGSTSVAVTAFPISPAIKPSFGSHVYGIGKHFIMYRVKRYILKYVTSEAATKDGFVAFAFSKNPNDRDVEGLSDASVYNPYVSGQVWRNLKLDCGSSGWLYMGNVDRALYNILQKQMGKAWFLTEGTSNGVPIGRFVLDYEVEFKDAIANDCESQYQQANTSPSSMSAVVNASGGPGYATIGSTSVSFNETGYFCIDWAVDGGTFLNTYLTQGTTLNYHDTYFSGSGTATYANGRAYFQVTQVGQYAQFAVTSLSNNASSYISIRAITATEYDAMKPKV